MREEARGGKPAVSGLRGEVALAVLKCCALVIAVGLACVLNSYADDIAKLSDDALIGQLAEINAPSPGLSPTDSDSFFFGGKKPIHHGSGLLGVPPLTVDNSMREIIRRGAAAMPSLISHLSDSMPTKLLVGNPLNPSTQHFAFWSEWFSAEYDPKDRLSPKTEVFLAKRGSFRGTYTVVVGDICYALIGQIVGRQLNAIRYQPTAILIINSPLHAPELIDRVKLDWGNFTTNSLRDFLLSDLDMSSDKEDIAQAMSRIRFYFPEIYNNLSGQELQKRAAFELNE